MKITVKLWASHRLGRFKEAQIEFPEGTRVSESVYQLGIAGKSLGVVLVNGKKVPLHRRLHNGDLLALFPLISGS